MDGESDGDGTMKVSVAALLAVLLVIALVLDLLCRSRLDEEQC